MSFEKKLKKAVESIEVPPQLSPENIEEMLRRLNPVQAEPACDDKPAVKERHISVSGKGKRTVIMRAVAAAAAFAALGVGLSAFNDMQKTTENIESEKDYKAVQIQSYDELYNIYTEIYLNSSTAAVGAENGDGVEINTDETDNNLLPAVTESVTPPSSGAVESAESVTTAAVTEYKEEVTEPVITRSDFSDADIVKRDDNSVYYLCSGTLYAVDKETLTVKAEIESEYAPFEMYVRGSSLVLISNSKGDSEENVVAEIYSTASGVPEKISVYKQNGSYTSARVDESGVLYLMTGYTDYHDAPLDEFGALENYVPAYYVNGEKRFVAANDISIPWDANNTDYTVISCVDCNEPENVSVKAVLGSGSNSYCSEDTLYVTGFSSSEGKEYTSVTSFSLSGNGLEYKASVVLEGELISSGSMAQTGTLFRIACRSYDENGMAVTDIYTLDSLLNVALKTDSLLPGTIIGKVRFEDSMASLYEPGGEDPVLIIDLTEKAAPADKESIKSYPAAYVSKFGDGMIGITSEGSQLKLIMYDGDSGEMINEIGFAQLEGVTSPALSDKNALLVDEVNGIIGVPVSGTTVFGTVSQYYVFTYTAEDGFIQKPVIEYNDISDGYNFERAMVEDDGTLLIVGSGCMVSVQLSDMTVIDKVDLN